MWVTTVRFFFSSNDRGNGIWRNVQIFTLAIVKILAYACLIVHANKLLYNIMHLRIITNNIASISTAENVSVWGYVGSPYDPPDDCVGSRANHFLYVTTTQDMRRPPSTPRIQPFLSVMITQKVTGKRSHEEEVIIIVNATIYMADLSLHDQRSLTPTDRD